MLIFQSVFLAGSLLRKDSRSVCVFSRFFRDHRPYSAHAKQIKLTDSDDLSIPYLLVEVWSR